MIDHGCIEIHPGIVEDELLKGDAEFY